MLTSLLAISLGAILTNNFIFSQFLGCCPFLGCSSKVDTATGMGIAVVFVMGLASAICWVIYTYILVPLNLAFLNTLAFILVIVLFASVRERIAFSDYPECFEGFPICLVSAGLVALAFMGFSGMKIF